MFIGREEELATIKGQLEQGGRTAILVYGKRRVGKSMLISKAVEDYEGVVINHLCVQSTYAGNLGLFARSICQALGLPSLGFPTIYDAFDFLKAQGKPVVVILDEYQYLKQSLREGEMDSLMQGVIDSLPDHVKIILCGSYITLMKELLVESNPLFGRFSAILHVREFDFLDAARFYPLASPHEKIANYALFGGSPFVLASIDWQVPLEETIEHLLLPETGVLRTYVESVMLREIQKSYDVRILEALGNGRKRYSEILSFLGGQNNGLLDKQLKALVGMETLAKTSPINRRRDAKKQFYQIEDNLMRLYFCYVFGNSARLAMLGEKEFYRGSIEPTIDHFVSRRMEAVALQYFMRLARAGMLPGIKDMGSLWYDDPQTKTNGEFDCVLAFADGFDFYECKYYRAQMTMSECLQEELQVRAVPGADVRNVGFICSAGFGFDSDEYDLISGEDLYSI